mgnify:CR=1 FL=1
MYKRAHKVFPVLAALYLSSAPAMAQEYLEPGEFVDQAAALDVTEAGLNGLIDLSLADLPSELVVGSVPTQRVWDGFFCDLDVIIDNLIINNSIEEIVVESTSSGLVLQVRAELAINSEDNPAVVELDGAKVRQEVLVNGRVADLKHGAERLEHLVQRDEDPEHGARERLAEELQQRRGGGGLEPLELAPARAVEAAQAHVEAEEGEQREGEDAPGQR